VAYELARAVEAGALAPPPVALFVAAASPPDLYARAVMMLYLTRPLADGEPPPRAVVLVKLAGWEALPRETLMLVRRPRAQPRRREQEATTRFKSSRRASSHRTQSPSSCPSPLHAARGARGSPGPTLASRRSLRRATLRAWRP